MWHKVSPISFRIPYIKNWVSTWYADKDNYATVLKADHQIRSALKLELKDIPAWDTHISRLENTVIVDIFTIKPALVLGKDNENLVALEKKLTKIAKETVKVNVKEIKKPDLVAKVVWFNVVNQIEKRMPYKRAIKQAIQRSMEKWAKWVKIKIGWRLNWAEIARKETFKEGNIPTQTIRADLDYCSLRAETVYWTLWIKIWIYKWDIYKK